MPSNEKMTPEQFCYWLQGVMEVSNPDALSFEQVQVIKDHLALVFTKVTPDRNDEETDLEKIMHEWSKYKDMTKPSKWENPFTPPYEVTCDTDNRTVC